MLKTNESEKAVVVDIEYPDKAARNKKDDLPAVNPIWRHICHALSASELPLIQKRDGSWYGENIVSDSDFISITPVSTRTGYGTASWSIHGVHMSGAYKDYRRFSLIMDEFLAEAGLTSASD